MRTIPRVSLRALRRLRLVSGVLLVLAGRAAAETAPPDRAAAATEPAAESPPAAGTQAGGASVSGRERDPIEPGQRAKQAIDVLTWIPRAALGALFYGVIYTEVRATDPRFIRQLTELTVLGDRRLTWYPKLWISSGDKPGYGLGLSYRGDRASADLGGVYSSSRRWTADFGLARDFVHRERNGRLSLRLKAAELNELDFYGFGADPASDPRNSFQGEPADQPFGRYGQELVYSGFVAGVRPSERSQLFGTVFYRRREIGESAPGAPDELSAVFDPATVPGYGTQGEQLYLELALEHDNRELRTMMSPGWMGEIHAGISAGVNGDPARFARFGLDMAAFLPVIKRNRLVVPRLVVNGIANLAEERDISFADYPRHRAFRGVSSQILLRTDRWSLVPSLAYQWPLSHLARATGFAESLVVGRELADLTFRDAPWTAGLELAAVINKRVLGSVLLANGSEGFRFALSLGLNLSDDRTKWN